MFVIKINYLWSFGKKEEDVERIPTVEASFSNLLYYNNISFTLGEL